MNFSEEQQLEAKAVSQKLINDWSHRDLVGPLIDYLNNLLSPEHNETDIS